MSAPKGIPCTKPGCTGKLFITHTYSVPGAKYQRAQCGACGRAYTVTNLISVEPVVNKHTGAQARAQAAAKAAGLQPPRLGGPWPVNGTALAGPKQVIGGSGARGDRTPYRGS